MARGRVIRGFGRPLFVDIARIIGSAEAVIDKGERLQGINETAAGTSRLAQCGQRFLDLPLPQIAE